MVSRRLQPTWNCLALMSVLLCNASVAVNGQGRKAAPSASRDADRRRHDRRRGHRHPNVAGCARDRCRARRSGLSWWTPTRCRRSTSTQWRDLDAFVPLGSRVIYLRRQSRRGYEELYQRLRSRNVRSSAALTRSREKPRSSHRKARMPSRSGSACCTSNASDTLDGERSGAPLRACQARRSPDGSPRASARSARAAAPASTPFSDRCRKSPR